MQAQSPRIIGAIAAMNKDRIIGLNNAIPWHYSEDFKRFKRVTLNSTIIMGRKTWESLGKKALPKRRNIVISRSKVADIESYTSINEALNQIEADEPIWFIGGGQIYQAALGYCNLLDITTVSDDVETTDAIFFPEIDADIWQAQPSEPLTADPRLSVQRFTRIPTAENH
ncbi:MAG: dihydrofolate reductase [Arenicellales bacterium]